jgi:hypothetical protein
MKKKTPQYESRFYANTSEKTLVMRVRFIEKMFNKKSRTIGTRN